MAATTRPEVRTPGRSSLLILLFALLLTLALGSLVPSLSRAEETQSKTIVGQVLNKAGSPIAGEPICISSEWSFSCPATSDDDGRYRIVVESYYARFHDLPQWPRVHVGKAWSDSRYRPVQFRTDGVTTIRTVLGPRKAAKGVVRNKKGRTLSGVQVCAGSDGIFFGGLTLRGKAPGSAQESLICDTSSRKGRYKLFLADAGELFVWDPKFVPLASKSSMSPLVQDVAPRTRAPLRVIKVRQSAPITVSGSTGMPKARVCLNSGADRFVAGCTISTDDASYQLQLRPWVLAAKPNRRAELTAAVSRAPLNGESPDPGLQAEAQLRLRPGGSTTVSWGALKVDTEGAATQAVCLSSKQTPPPASVGMDIAPWLAYCDYFYSPLGGQWNVHEPLFFRSAVAFRVGYERGLEPIWVGPRGAWDDARVFDVTPGQYVVADLVHG
ncbi:MAG: hypothetical protein KDC39_15955 [Actinobacteria bacterium]|nr:hypothetical protein [Actinomycetota bacterium]